MIASRSDTARLQSDFYRDQFRRMVRWLMVSVILMFVLIALTIYSILSQPTQVYFANTSEGRILDMPSSVTN